MTGKPMTIQVAPCRCCRRSSAELQPDLKQLVESWWEITQLPQGSLNVICTQWDMNGDDWDLGQDCFVKLGFTFTKFTKVEISSEKKKKTNYRDFSSCSKGKGKMALSNMSMDMRVSCHDAQRADAVLHRWCFGCGLKPPSRDSCYGCCFLFSHNNECGCWSNLVD